MSRIKSPSLLLAMTTIVLVGVLLFAGCSQTPVDPTVNSEPQLLTRAVRAAGSASLAPVNLYAEKVISTTQGGTLSLLDVTMTIPPGAVPNDTLFSIFIPDDTVFFNEFGTDGLVFNKPVVVTMSYRQADLSGVKESTIRLAWYNKSTGTFEDVPCDVDLVAKTVTATLSHFSAYGLISD